MESKPSEPKLYEQNEVVVPYKLYTGKLLEQIDCLYTESRELLSLSDLLERRLEVLSSDYSKEVQDFWLNSMLYSCDGILRKDNKVKFVKDLVGIISYYESHLGFSNGALVMDNEVYNRTDGLELSLENLKKYISKNNTKEEGVRNPILNYFIPNPDLLKEYFSAAVKLSKEDKLLGVFIDDPQKDKTTVRIAYLSTLMDQSKVCVYHHLDQSNAGKIVGALAKKLRT